MTTQSKQLQWPEPMPELRGPWLGQVLASDHAVEFCPALLRDTQRVAGITFDPRGEEAFFTWNTPDRADLMHTAMVDGLWTLPKPAPFNSMQVDNDICMAPDGQRVCWRSWRSLQGTEEQAETVSLWAVDRAEDGWGKPFPVECGGSRQSAVYPGIGLNGTLYFSVEAAGGMHIVARAKRQGQQYESRETIIPRTSSGGDLCVSPDESFLVVTVYSQPEGGTRSGSLHVSFRNPDDTWTPLQDLGLAVDSETTEYCPTISADGRWLFFCHLRREQGEVTARARWIGTDFIRRLRP